MLDANSLNTLTIKRQKISLGFPFFIFLFFVALVTVWSLWFVCHPWHGRLDIIIYYRLMSIIAPITLIACLLTYFPGRADLTLTPEGFEMLDANTFTRKQYRWADVVGFYPESKPRYYKLKDPLVCFDKANCTTKWRKVVIPFYYELDSQTLVDLLNEWKERYAPNPEGVVLDPLPKPPKILAIYSKKGQKILKWFLAIHIFIMIVTVIGMLVYGKLTHENRTHTTIMNTK